MTEHTDRSAAGVGRLRAEVEEMLGHFVNEGMYSRILRELVACLTALDAERDAILANGWVCEQHPSRPFPHDDCAGPGELLPAMRQREDVLHAYRENLAYERKCREAAESRVTALEGALRRLQEDKHGKDQSRAGEPVAVDQQATAPTNETKRTTAPLNSKEPFHFHGPDCYSMWGAGDTERLICHLKK